MTIREALDKVCIGWSIQAPENQGLHSWRCQYPDRYGKCQHYQEFLDDLVMAVASLDKDDTQ